ncbi:MAG: tetratricopeptide repeat protein [Pseudomonadota bacterium]
MKRSVSGALGAMLLIAGACAPAHVRDYRAREHAETTRLELLEATPAGDLEALAALEGLARDATVKTVAARAAVRAGDRHLEGGHPGTAAQWWRIAVRLDPEGGWARAGVERLHDSWETLPAPALEVRLRSLRHPALDGMLLYLAAARHARSPGGRERAVELCLLQRQRTPRSAYRDDCEELVLSLLGRDDRIRFARIVLVPLPSDDPAAMDAPRFQRIELDLARDLIAAGRTDAARRRLRRVVDRYPSMRIKDDALWLLAGLYRRDGAVQPERSTLRTLIENLPQSRYRVEAERRLERLR